MAHRLLHDPGGPEARFLVSRKLEDHKAQILSGSICSSLQGLPCSSLTVDNGKEFAAHKETSTGLAAPIFFCQLHSPWEKPTNENTNGLLRQFFPKYTSFLAVTQEHLDWAVDLLNNRPCKCLGWKTPFQAMSEGLLHLDYRPPLYKYYMLNPVIFKSPYDLCDDLFIQEPHNLIPSRGS